MKGQNLRVQVFVNLKSFKDLFLYKPVECRVGSKMRDSEFMIECDINDLKDIDSTFITMTLTRKRTQE